MDANETRELVRSRYAKTAQAGSSCCSPSAGSAAGGCCGGAISADDLAKTIGYSEAELAMVPDGANLGLGCGNPASAHP